MPEALIDEERVQAMALLQLLALGAEEIEAGKYREAKYVFADIDRAERNKTT